MIDFSEFYSIQQILALDCVRRMHLAEGTNNDATMRNLKTIAENDADIAMYLLQNPNVLESLLIPCFNILCKRAYYVSVSEIRREYLPPEFFRRVFSSKRYVNLAALLMRKECPLEELDRMSKRKGRDCDFYIAIANNPKSTKTILKRLLRYRDYMSEYDYVELVSAVMNNRNFPMELRMQYMLEQ